MVSLSRATSLYVVKDGRFIVVSPWRESFQYAYFLWWRVLRCSMVNQAERF